MHEAVAEAAGAEAWAAAALTFLSAAGKTVSGDPNSPWGVADGWRLNIRPETEVQLRQGAGAAVRVAVRRDAAGWVLDLPTGRVVARLEAAGGDGAQALILDGARSIVRVIRGVAATVIVGGRNHVFTHIDPLSPPAAEDAGVGTSWLLLRRRGWLRCSSHPGMRVVKGQKLLILEAMKVETAFTAPFDGVVEAVQVRAGELVQEGAGLVRGCGGRGKGKARGSAPGPRWGQGSPDPMTKNPGPRSGILGHGVWGPLSPAGSRGRAPGLAFTPSSAPTGALRMQHETVIFQAAGLTMHNQLFWEPGSGKRAGVLVFPEAFGLGEHTIGRARRLAARVMLRLPAICMARAG